MKDKKTFERKIGEIVKNFNLGFFVKAEGLAKKLLEKNKQNYQLCNIYGLILFKNNKVELAINYFHRSIKIKSDFFEAHFNLFRSFYRLKQYDEAILQSQKCLKLNPKSIDTLILLGNIYNNNNQEKVSENYYLEILNINSKESKAYYSLGNLYQKKKEYDKAINNYNLAIKFNKNDIGSYNNLGVLYQEIGEFDLAISNFKSVIKINPKFLGAYQNYLYCLNFSKHFDAKLYFELARQFKQNLPKIDLKKINQFPKIKKSDNRIRIGFVSGDYGYHPVSYYLLNIINHIDKKKFKLIAYSNSNRMDEFTLKLKKKFSSWRKINNLNDIEVINIIRKDSINILFDLSGHTAKNRLSIFVSKAAPVQVTWLGYNASTGLKEIDYIIVDPYVVPLNDQKYFTEKIYHLPNTFQCISINDDIKINHKKNRETKGIIFGSFNNLSKINDDVINLWSKIINKVNNSKLYLKAKQFDNSQVVKKIRKKFQNNGVSVEKIIFDGKSKSRKEMLNKYNQIDIALDPFPYQGCTNTVESVWMGVPVIVLRGNRYLFHFGECINSNLNMPDWIAKNHKEYISKAIKFSSNIHKLSKIRMNLRQMILQSPICNAPRLAEHFSNALWNMWKKFQNQK